VFNRDFLRYLTGDVPQIANLTNLSF
jgi:hypothetical protein